MGDTAPISGGSAGIGRALARQFAAAGHDLVLVARREDRLEEAAADLATRHGVDCQTVTRDLAELGSARCSRTSRAATSRSTCS